MIVLGLDSAQAACSAAVRRDGLLVARRREDMSRGHAEALVPMAVAVLAEAELDFARIEAVAVTVGPGSFTGIRVGLAAAQGIALACTVPIIGVSSFEAVWRQAIERLASCGRARPDVLVVLETKRTDFYVQRFAPGGSALDAARALTAPEIERDCLTGRPVLAGDGVDRLRRTSASALAGIEQLHEVRISDAADVAAIGAERLARLRADGQPVPAPRPLYLRPPDVTLPDVRRGMTR